MANSTISEELVKLINTKAAIKQSLINKGKEPSDFFDTYDDEIDEIETVEEATADATATENDILQNKTAYVQGEKITGAYVPLDTSDADAVADNIDQGKTAYVNGIKITGTSTKIDTSDANATPEYIIGGEHTAYVNGEKIRGTSFDMYGPSDNPVLYGGFVQLENRGSGQYYVKSIVSQQSVVRKDTLIRISATNTDLIGTDKAQYITSGHNILGVQGTAIELQGEEKTIDPSTSQQVITPSTGKNGITQVTVNAVDNTIDNNIISGNIKSGITILGITGTYSDAMKEYISEAAMNTDIDNIEVGEVVKVTSGNTTTHYIKDGEEPVYQPLDLSTLSTGDTVSLKGMKINGEAKSNVLTGTGDQKTITFSNGANEVLKLYFHGGASKISGNVTVEGSVYNYTSVSEGGTSVLFDEDLTVEIINSSSIWNDDTLLTVTKDSTSPQTEIEGAILHLVGGYSMRRLADTSDATATSADIATGKTAYVNGVKVTGIGAMTFATVSEMEAVTTVPEDTLAIVYGLDYVGTYRFDNGSWTEIGSKSVGQQSMDALNAVDGSSDQYEGLGGTEEEVNEVLDEIIEGSQEEEVQHGPVH